MARPITLATFLIELTVMSAFLSSPCQANMLANDHQYMFNYGNLRVKKIHVLKNHKRAPPSLYTRGCNPSLQFRSLLTMPEI